MAGGDVALAWKVEGGDDAFGWRVAGGNGGTGDAKPSIRL